jgi:CRISPR-associated protein Cas2
MFYSICYDVRDDRRRTRLFKILKDFGDAVQFSVFEANLEPGQLEQLLKRSADVLNDEEDSLRLYPLCGMCQSKIEIIGQGHVTQDPEFIII